MNDKSKEKNLDFEKSLAKLENIIEALEDGDLPLNESIKTFEEGVNLLNTVKNFSPKLN